LALVCTKLSCRSTALTAVLSAPFKTGEMPEGKTALKNTSPTGRRSLLFLRNTLKMTRQLA
jgi:hypothetical protein